MGRRRGASRRVRPRRLCTRPALPQAGGGTARVELPRARPRPARTWPLRARPALGHRDTRVRRRGDTRGAGRGGAGVGRPQFRRAPRPGARRAEAGADPLRGTARPRDPDPPACRVRLRAGGSAGSRLRVGGRGDRGPADQRQFHAARVPGGRDARASRAVPGRSAPLAVQPRGCGDHVQRALPRTPAAVGAGGDPCAPRPRLTVRPRAR
jgi:hypothetical protein